jgi:hypothetical protein
MLPVASLFGAHFSFYSRKTSQRQRFSSGFSALKLCEEAGKMATLHFDSSAP